MFIDSQNRVKSMAVIHEILFQSRDIAKIDFAEYIKTISVQLFRSYGAYSQKIALVINVKDIILDVDTAIPCGLIVTELVSNSLKYAFVDGRDGKISIDFEKCHLDMLKLTVSDNGVGFQKNISIEEMESLGLKLVVALVKQLSGIVEIDHTHGTTFNITFSDDKRKERKDDHGTPTDPGC
jgi:two-component sensor histidine kinase